jgi:hypothetical protein
MPILNAHFGHRHCIQPSESHGNTDSAELLTVLPEEAGFRVSLVWLLVWCDSYNLTVTINSFRLRKIFCDNAAASRVSVFSHVGLAGNSAKKKQKPAKKKQKSQKSPKAKLAKIPHKNPQLAKVWSQKNPETKLSQITEDNISPWVGEGKDRKFLRLPYSLQEFDNVI